MSNGVDNIYDTSDVRRRLYEIGQERRQLIEDKRKKREDIIKTGTSALDYWSTEQRAKTQELLALKDQGENVFEMNPDYVGKKGIPKFFTGARERVRATEFGQEYLEANPQLQDPNTIGKTISQGAKDIGKTVSKGAKDISESSEKFFGTDLGQWLSVFSAGKGLVDIMDPKFRKKSDIDKAFGIGKTALSAATIFKPGLGLWGLGLSALDWLRKR